MTWTASAIPSQRTANTTPFALFPVHYTLQIHPDDPGHFNRSGETVVCARLATAERITLPVFEEKERTDNRPKARTEGLFAFYDRVSGRPFSIFRDVVNRWVAEMPAETAAEIVARMRKGEDLGFATARSEIMLHAVFHRLGFIPEPHPTIVSTPNRPDFLLRRPSQERVA